jgi:hypothetical protein
MFFASKILNIQENLIKILISYKENYCYEIINYKGDIEQITNKYFYITQTSIYTNLQINFQHYTDLIDDIKKHINVLSKQNRKIRVYIDYFGVNFGKVVHNGHLRSLIYGHILKKIYQSLGFTVITDTHFGDSNIHILKYCVYFKKKETSISELDNISISELNNIYIEMNKQKIDILDDQSQEILKNLKIQGTYEHQIKNIITIHSIKYILQILNILDIEHTHYFTESKYYSLCNYLIDFFLTTGQFTYNKDNKIVTNNNIVVTTSKGDYLYAMIDIATIIERSLYKIDRICYVVDKRQEKYFLTLFDFIKKEIPSDITLCHIKYGYVYDLNNEIMSSRHKCYNILDIINSLLQKGYSNKEIKLGCIFYEIRHRIQSDYLFIERIFLQSIEEAKKFINIVNKIIKYKDKNKYSEKNTLTNIEKNILVRLVQLYEMSYQTIEDNNLDKISLVLLELKNSILKIDLPNLSDIFYNLFSYSSNIIDILLTRMT